VLDLQQAAGNAAVNVALQRDRAPFTRPTVGRFGEPIDVPDIRSALRSRFPALLRGLTETQLDQWQTIVRYHYVEPYLRRARQAAATEAYAKHGEVWREDRQWQATERELDRALPAMTDSRITIEASTLLADDVNEKPEWDVAAELRFRQWAVDRLTKAPLELTTVPTEDDGLNRHVLPGLTFKLEQGFITAQTLRNYFPEEYKTQVLDRVELVKLHEALVEMGKVQAELSTLHKQRSDKNVEHPVVRHISELFGSGHHRYPTLHIWDEPDALRDKGAVALGKRQFEMAVPLIAMAEQATAAAAENFSTYEERVMSGAATTVKWLGRLKTAGSIAASIASGPLGLTGSALVAGGYTLAQEGAGRAAEVAYGQRKDMGWGSLIEDAGISSLMTLIGGALQSRFQAAMKVRLDALGMAGKGVDIATSAAAAGTSSVYTTAAEIVLKRIVSGEALPKSAEDLANLIVDNAVQNVVMDVGLHPVGTRVGQEYEAWKSGRETAVVTIPGAEHESPSHVGASAPAEEAPHRLTEPAVRRLLQEGGGWERLNAELRTGTGLGATMTVPERQALIDRFEAHRKIVAEDVASVFGGHVSVTEAISGSVVEVRFAGAEGQERVADAHRYLDAKQPGWEQSTQIDLATTAAPEASSATGPQATLREIQANLRPGARHLADEFLPLFAQWPKLSPGQRVARLTAIVNRGLVNMGVPPLEPRIDGTLQHAGQMDPATWELVIREDMVTDRTPLSSQFAELCGLAAHEGRHALQWFRAARTNPDPNIINAHRMRPDVFQAAIEANTGKRPGAEPLAPGSAAHADAQVFYESIWGNGHAYRERVYKTLKRTKDAYREAMRNRDKVFGEHGPGPERDAAQMHFEVSQNEYHRADEAYRDLPEEVDAYTWGTAVEAQVGEHLRIKSLRVTYDRLIANERRAFADFRQLEQQADDLAAKKQVSPALSEQMQRAFAELERLQSAIEKLDDQIGRAIREYSKP